MFLSFLSVNPLFSPLAREGHDLLLDELDLHICCLEEDELEGEIHRRKEEAIDLLDEIKTPVGSGNREPRIGSLKG